MRKDQMAKTFTGYGSSDIHDKRNRCFRVCFFSGHVQNIPFFVERHEVVFKVLASACACPHADRSWRDSLAPSS
jgi:hypothetical protein